MRKLMVVILLLALTGCARIQAANLWYVAPNGSDSNNGSITSPFATINKAVSMASAGDTIYLRGGTYHQTVYVGKSGTENAPIVVAGYPDEIAIIDGGHTLPTSE